MARRQLWGVILIILGLLAFAQISGYRLGLSFWPVVLTLVGGYLFQDGIRKRISWFETALGLWLMGTGLGHILYDVGLLAVNGDQIFRAGWPVLLVAIGLSILFKPRRLLGCQIDVEPKHFRTIGDVRYGQAPWVLDSDMLVEHGIGDVKIDLTNAEITPGLHQIQVRAGMGEVVLRVPDQISVTAEAKIGMGEVFLLDQHRGGMGITLSRSVDLPEAQVQLHIDIKMGLGSVRVTKGPAKPPVCLP